MSNKNDSGSFTTHTQTHTFTHIDNKTILTLCKFIHFEMYDECADVTFNRCARIFACVPAKQYRCIHTEQMHVSIRF